MKHFRILGLLLGLLIGATPSYAIVKSLGGGSGGGGGSGTVTSVGLTAPSVFSVSGSPVTTAGTIGVTFATGQTQNQFLATPDGASGAIGLRSIVAGDLPAGVPTAAANPTGTIGLTAVNGSATTFLRSDGAPALSQAIVPTWTGIHTWTASGTGLTAGVQIVSATPSLLFQETDQGTDAKNWDILVNSSQWTVRAINDAGSAARNAFQATRSGAAITNITLGNVTDTSASLTFQSNGTFTTGGGIQTGTTQFVNSGRFVVQGTGVPANGIYLPAASTLGFSTSTTSRGSFDANGQFNLFGVGATASGIFSQLTASTAPIMALERTGSATDAKYWTVDASGSNGLTINAVNDAFSVSRAVLAVTRSGAGITGLGFGNGTDNPTYSFFGSGLTTFTGQVTAPGVTVTGSTVPVTGIYARGGGVLSMATGSNLHAELTAGGIMNALAPGTFGTKFTTTGCSVSATTGGASAGTFTLGANTCTVVVTLAGATGVTATNGWSCSARDRTAPTVLIGGESSSTTTTASIAIPVTAGATDVISFNCTAF